LVLWGSALVPGGDCHIVHSYDAPYSERMRLCGWSSAMIEASAEDAEAAARESFEKLFTATTAGSRIHMHLVHGNPLGTLVTEIARHAPQVVVVGRHDSDPGQSAHDLNGSTALRMAYHTPVDVLVVP
jgi:nucleotide-binding universal stress UspA family protein